MFLKCSMRRLIFGSNWRRERCRCLEMRFEQVCPNSSARRPRTRSRYECGNPAETGRSDLADRQADSCRWATSATNPVVKTPGDRVSGGGIGPLAGIESTALRAAPIAPFNRGATILGGTANGIPVPDASADGRLCGLGIGEPRVTGSGATACRQREPELGTSHPRREGGGSMRTDRLADLVLADGCHISFADVANLP